MPNLSPPSKLGLPARFDPWRPAQERAILAALESDARFVALALPTGAGKSLVGVALAKLTRATKAIYVTSTKGLQDQVHGDHPKLIADLRGKGDLRYPCLILHAENDRMVQEAGFGLDQSDRAALTAEAGPCQSRMRCEWKANGCPYYDAVREAGRKTIVLTNYAKWLSYASIDAVKEELGLPELLILDEAHETENWLEKAVECTLTFAELDEHLRMEPHPGVRDKPSAWIEWGRRAVALVRAENHAIEQALQFHDEHAVRSGRDAVKLYKQARVLRNLLRRLERLASGGGEWIVEQAGRGKRAGIKAAPVWPTAWAEQMLFRGIERVVLMSASIRPKTLDLLGIPNRERLYLELPSDFPISRRPIIPVKTARLSRASTPEQLAKWQTTMDTVIRDRADRKGLIFPVSYERAYSIGEKSSERARIMTHAQNSDATRNAVRKFKRTPSSSGLVLASPAIDTGWDFPGPDAEYGILAKMPFQNPNTALFKARTKRDPEYADYLVAKKIEQIAGRGMRSRVDLFELIVLDDHFWWFIWAKKHLFHQYFLDAVRKPLDAPPKPPKKLDESAWQAAGAAEAEREHDADEDEGDEGDERMAGMGTPIAFPAPDWSARLGALLPSGDAADPGERIRLRGGDDG